MTMRTIVPKLAKKKAHLMIHGNYNVSSRVSLVDTPENDNEKDDISTEHRRVVR